MQLLRELYSLLDDPNVDVTQIARFFSDDYRDLDRAPNAPLHLSDKQAHLSILEELKRGFSSLRHEIELMAPLPDGKIVVYWTFQGRHVATFFGVPPSGREARIRGIDIYTISDGRLTEQRHCEDVAGLMSQLNS
jgi:steroid delta-isomerase-like uncharacterized protein